MKYLKNITLLVLAMFVTSCGTDYLDPAPTGGISDATFYSNDSQLLNAIMNMYDGIQGTNVLKDSSKDKLHALQYEFYLTEMRSDNTRTKSSEGEAAQFESYTVQNANGIVSDYYQSFYNVIFRANTVLANLDVAIAENAGKYEGEAKFVRAYAYFNLVRLFGDIPLIDHVIGVNDTDIQFTRVASSEIYTLIVSDLQKAIETLDNSEINRASQRAAQALLVKVYLTMHTNYIEAQQLCEAIIAQEGATLGLMPNFKDVFFTEGNQETLFAIGYLPDGVDSQNFSAEWQNAIGRSSGLNYVTTEAAAALDALGGDRTPYSYRIDPTQPTQKQVVKYLNTGDAALGIAPTSNDDDLAGNDWIVLRYADVLLMHVEAIMAGGTSTNAVAALASFQKVRDRAGLTDTVTNITKQELLDERRVELAFENQRLFDLVRFGVAQDVLSAYSTANNYSFTATQLLLPIPQREINLSKGKLTQNPGY
tara:strand:- start:270 stop:1706 length:1437 start_codon:yes stop_codon:yes gene_type:complete